MPPSLIIFLFLPSMRWLSLSILLVLMVVPSLGKIFRLAVDWFVDNIGSAGIVVTAVSVVDAVTDFIGSSFPWIHSRRLLWERYCLCPFRGQSWILARLVLLLIGLQSLEDVFHLSKLILQFRIFILSTFISCWQSANCSFCTLEQISFFDWVPCSSMSDSTILISTADSLPPNSPNSNDFFHELGKTHCLYPLNIKSYFQ